MTKAEQPKRKFNMAFQVAEHTAMHMWQWPNSDRKEVERDTRRLLRKGQAWLHTEPEQMELAL